METIIHNNIKFYKIKNSHILISKCGKIYSEYKKRLIIINPYKKYPLIKYSYQGIIKWKLLHRLIAEAFIPNPENKPCVNHIDGDPTNNHIDNLEWCTYSENEKHSYQVLGKKPNKTGLRKFGKLHHNSRKVKQLDLNDNLIKIWDSFADIKRDLNISNVHQVCNNLRKTAGNYKWEYL